MVGFPFKIKQTQEPLPIKFKVKRWYLVIHFIHEECVKIPFFVFCVWIYKCLNDVLGILINVIIISPIIFDIRTEKII